MQDLYSVRYRQVYVEVRAASAHEARHNVSKMFAVPFQCLEVRVIEIAHSPAAERVRRWWHYLWG